MCRYTHARMSTHVVIHTVNPVKYCYVHHFSVSLYVAMAFVIITDRHGLSKEAHCDVCQRRQR